jgi:uncharacterized membrane protein
MTIKPIGRLVSFTACREQVMAHAAQLALRVPENQGYTRAQQRSDARVTATEMQFSRPKIDVLDLSWLRHEASDK